MGGRPISSAKPAWGAKGEKKQDSNFVLAGVPLRRHSLAPESLRAQQNAIGSIQHQVGDVGRLSTGGAGCVCEGRRQGGVLG